MAVMNVWLQMARSQFQANDLDAALGSVNQALQVESTADAWALKERILTEKATRGERAIGEAMGVADVGDRLEQLQSFERAIAIDEDSLAAWEEKAELLRKLGKWNEVVEVDEKITDLRMVDFYIAKGVELCDCLGEYESAIAYFNQALRLKPNSYWAWCDRGVAFNKLKQYEESITSCEKAIEINPVYPEAWNLHGHALSESGKHEDSLISYKKAIELKPDLHEAWFNYGVSLAALGRHNEVISSYDKAIELKLDFYGAFNNRGLSLAALERYEEAISSYDKAIEFKADDHEVWNVRGNSLYALGQYEEAVTSYEKAIEFKPDYHYAWLNRSSAAANSLAQSPFPLPFILNQRLASLHLKHPELTQRGYFGVLSSLTVGLIYCPADTHPLGHGFLQQSLGDAHWKYADRRSPRPKWLEALTHYEQSEKVLTIADHPEERLQTLQRLVRAHFALNTPTETLTALIRQGAELRDRILTQAKSPQQRDRLHRTLPNFNEFTVDLLLRQGETIRAIETAEADKNGLMQWLLPSTETPNYHQMRQWVAHRTVVYWHFSANALTTFILTAERDRPIVLSQPDPETALKQRNELETWIENWNKNYNTHLENSKNKTDKTEKTRSEWQNNLETELEKLATILDIPTLITHLSNTKPLILIPHRDLHRLPLPSLFPRHLTTTLPSIQLGRNLRTPHPITHLLNIPAPSHQDTFPLPEASLESIALDCLLTAQNIPVKTIDRCNLTQLQTALPNHHTHLHFNGHAYYNDQNPRQSALALEGTDRLTVEDLASIDLHHYSLITLASCETALTGNQTITAEYVGLVSALLSHGIPHILSTLWTVESKASALLILQFYRQLLKGRSPAQSLHHSQHWLRTLTNRKLDRLYRTVLASLPIQEPHIRPFIETECDNLGTINPHDQPYQNPYFWAAFILAGRH